MIDLHDVIIAPVLSEKATALREENKYVFKVHPSASKIQIKEAVAKLQRTKSKKTRSLRKAAKKSISKKSKRSGKKKKRR